MSNLPQQNTIVQYVADGITTQYSVPFYVPLETNNQPDIAVYVTLPNATPVPAADLQLWNVNYNYAPQGGNVPFPGGTVIFLSGSVPINGAIITISRNVIDQQDVEFSQAINFNGTNLDEALNKLMLLIQQNLTTINSRVLQYVVNSYIPQSTIAANTQLPLLKNNQIWVGQGTGVIAATLNQSGDTSLLRSQLANNSPGTDGALLVGFYDTASPNATTVDAQLTQLKLFGNDTGSTNALAINMNNTINAYYTGMRFLVVAANTNTGAATFNFNSIGNKAIVRNDGVTATQPGDILAGHLIELQYNGTNMVLINVPDHNTGIIVQVGFTPPPAGYLLCNGQAVSRTQYSALFNVLSFQQTGTLTASANTVSGLTDTSLMFTGMAVTGTNVPANTTIASVVDGNNITLSANATGSGATSLRFYNYGAGDGSTTFNVPNISVTNHIYSLIKL